MSFAPGDLDSPPPFLPSGPRPRGWGRAVSGWPRGHFASVPRSPQRRGGAGCGAFQRRKSREYTRYKRIDFFDSFDFFSYGGSKKKGVEGFEGVDVFEGFQGFRQLSAVCPSTSKTGGPMKKRKPPE